MTGQSLLVFLTGTDECGRIYSTTSNTFVVGSVQAYVAPVLRFQ